MIDVPLTDRRSILTAAAALCLVGAGSKSASAHNSGVGNDLVGLFDPGADATSREVFWTNRLSHGGRRRWTLPDFQKVTARVAAASGGFDLLDTQDAGGQLRLQVRSRSQGAVRWLRIRRDRDDPQRLFDIGLAPTPAPYDRVGPAGPVSRNALGLEIERRIRFAAQRDEFSGAVSVVAPDGATVCKMAVGRARRDPDLPALVDTRFNIGSADKSFTALMIGRLVADGLLSFDTRLIEALPHYPNLAFARACTIQHLLTHASGLGALFDRPGWDWNKRFSRMSDLFPVFAQQSATFAPGTSTAYSNEGFVVLGAVIEGITGASWYDLLAAQVYAPAGMTRSGHFQDVTSVPDLAIGYAYRQEDDLGLQGRASNDGYRGYRGSSCGGGYSTVEDMTAWLRSMRDGRLLTLDLVEALVAPQRAGLSDYARGFTRRTVAGRTLIGHGGGGPHSGIDGDHFIVWETGWTVSVLGNYDAPFARELAQDIGRWVALQPA